jgi:WD40 repeat protein
MAHPITVMYSMSGAGKSSLINARLIPDLQNERCVVLPPARVSGVARNVDPGDVTNIYVFHVVMSWQAQREVSAARAVKTGSLTDELAPYAALATKDDSLLVVIFDQFEEMFSTDTVRWRDRQGFFEQLSDAVESFSNVRVLIALREDYVASLDRYANLVPENFRTRSQLERLRREAALEAVINPLAGTGRSFAPGVAEALVDNLMTIRVRPDREMADSRSDDEDADLLALDFGSSSYDCIPVVDSESDGHVTISEFVEPVQLQVVCHNLWANLPPNESVITAKDLELAGDVNQALSGFYEGCVKQAALLPSLTEGVVRRWFEARLITPAGTRGLALRGPSTTDGLPNDAVDIIEQQHLIRAEDRGGAKWYELSHDRFIEAVRHSNRRWEKTRPNRSIWLELRSQSAKWETAPDDEKPSLLLPESDLIKAEAWWKSEHSSELGRTVRIKRFLDASRLAADTERDRRDAKARVRKLKLLGVFVPVLAVVALLLGAGWYWAYVQTGYAEKSKDEAEQRRLEAEQSKVDSQLRMHQANVSKSAMQAQTAADLQPRDALLHIQEALEEAENSLRSALDEHTQDSIRNSLSRVRHRAKFGPYGEPVSKVVFAPSGWGGPLRKALDPKGAHPMLAFGRRDGKVELWDLGDYDDPTDDKPVVPGFGPSTADASSSALWINQIVFDPRENGRTIAFTTGNTSSVNLDDRGSAWVWIAPESPDGQGELRALKAEPDSGPAADISFSPDGSLLAVAHFVPGRAGAAGTGAATTWSGIARLYRTVSLRSSDHAPVAVAGPAQSVAFDRSGDRLVVASGDRNGNHPNLPGQVVVYDLNTNMSVPMKQCVHPAIRAVFSPDGTAVVSGGIDGIARVNNPQNGDLIATLVGHAWQITDLDFSHDGTRLVTASGDRTARVWSPSTWSPTSAASAPASWSSQLTMVGHKAMLNSAQFNSDGTLIVTASYDGTARVWDAQTGECLVTHVGHEGPVNAARFSARGFLLATAGSDGTARVWATGTVETARLMLSGHEAAVRDVEFRPGETGRYQAVTAGADGVALLWDVSDWSMPGIRKKALHRYVPSSSRAALSDTAFSPDGHQLAAASLDGTVHVWQVDSEASIRVIRLPEAEIEAGRADVVSALGVTFSPKGKYLLTSWSDGRMRLFHGDGADTTPLADWPGSATRLTPQLFDSDDQLVVTPNAGVPRVQGRSGSVRVWNVEKQAVEQTLDAPTGGLGPVADLAVDPKSGAIAAATLGPGGAAILWNATGGYHLACRPLRHSGGVERLAFNPHGTKLATEAEDGIGRIWALPIRDGQRPDVESLPGLTGPSPLIAFGDSHVLSDGGYLATDFGAAVGQIWNAASGKGHAQLKGPRDRLVFLDFLNAPAAEIASIARDNRLQLWSLTTGDPLGSCRGPAMVPTAAAVGPDGRVAVSGAVDGTLKLWNTNSGTVMSEQKAHTAKVMSVAFSADGRRIVSAGRDGKACVWEMPKPEPANIESPRSTPGLKALAVLPHTGKDNHVSVARFIDREGHRVATGIGDLNRFRWQSPELDWPDPGDCSAEFDALAYRVDLSGARIGAAKPIVAVSDLKRGSAGPDAPLGVLAAAVSPVGKGLFLSCGGPLDDARSNIVRAGDAVTAKPDAIAYAGHRDAILDVSVSPDGSRIATASADNTARIWSVPYDKSGAVELRGHSGDVSSVTFSPNGDYIMSISRQDGTARIWDIDGGDPIYLLATRRAGLNSATINDPIGPRQFTDDVAAAAFSPDGQLVITANGDGSARVYTLELCEGFKGLKQVAQRRLNGFSD